MALRTYEELLKGFINNQLSQEELIIFLNRFQQDKSEEEFFNSIENILSTSSCFGLSDPNKSDIVYKNILNAIENEEGSSAEKIFVKAKPTRYLWLRAAASISGLLILISYFLLKNTPQSDLTKTNEIHSIPNEDDHLPGGNKALLTLNDGSTIALDDVGDGNLINEGGSKLIKVDGKLNYKSIISDDSKILYHTVSTPKGGQFQIELSDGSKIWLNAASSIRFPTSFIGEERRVKVIGEAYFEISKNTKMPFIIDVNNVEVQVLGTSFNIMSYTDEPFFKTTLLEGSVKLIMNNSSKVLKPGQQSQISKNGEIKILNNVDLNNVMAWKNGFYSFYGDDIETILRQLARWYDVEIVYKDKIEDLFYADIPRNTKLSDVLKALELTGKIQFEIKGKSIIVKPYK
jgi:transmembrane sensor